MLDNDFELFRGANQYSLAFMNYGYMFINDPKYNDRRRDSTAPAAEDISETGEPAQELLRYSLFARLNR